MSGLLQLGLEVRLDPPLPPPAAPAGFTRAIANLAAEQAARAAADLERGVDPREVAEALRRFAEECASVTDGWRF